MKKLFFLALVLIVISPTIFAQTDPQVQQLFQMVKILQEQRKMDSIRIASMRDSLSNNQFQYSRIDTELQVVSSRLSEAQKKMDLSAKAQYDVVRSNMLISAEMLTEINKRLNTLQALTQAQNYEAMVTQLNNPTDGSLGFSYQDKVMELLDKHVPIKSDKGKFLDYAKMILQNPIVNGVASLTPVLSIGNTILSFASSMAAQDKKATPQDVMTFKNALAGYTIYYTKLAEVTNTYQVSMKGFMVGSNNLHQKTEEFTASLIQQNGFRLENKQNDMTSGDYLNALFRTYNPKTVRQYLDDLEKKYTDSKGKVNHERILNETKLPVMNSRIDDALQIYREFDYLYRQYISMVEQHQAQTVEVLGFAGSQKLSPNPEKVTQTIEKMKLTGKEAISRVRTSIDILAIEDLAKQLVR